MTQGTTTFAVQSLLDRIRSAPDDRSARQELVAISYDRLSHVARRLLGPAYRQRPEDTSGLLAEAYFRLDTALAEVRPESMRQYLGLAALQMRRAMIDLIRKSRGRGTQAKELAAIEENDAIADTETGDPDWRLELMDAMAKLADDEREVVDLLFFHGLSQVETAELVGVDERTIKRRWSRARVRLSHLLASFELDELAAG